MLILATVVLLMQALGKITPNSVYDILGATGDWTMEVHAWDSKACFLLARIPQNFCVDLKVKVGVSMF